MDDSRLLQESNYIRKADTQGAKSRHKASEGLPYVVARGGVEPVTFRSEGFGHHHSTNHALEECYRSDWGNNVLIIISIIFYNDFSVVGPSIWNGLSSQLRIFPRALSPASFS